jgi:hypothetical protein
MKTVTIALPIVLIIVPALLLCPPTSHALTTHILRSGAPSLTHIAPATLIYSPNRRIYLATRRADLAATRVSRSREPVQRSAPEPRSAAFRNNPSKQIAHPARARNGNLGARQMRFNRDSGA